MSDKFQESLAHQHVESRAHQRILGQNNSAPPGDVGKTWHAAANHLCSGYAPFIYSQRGSKSWTPDPQTSQEIADNQWVTAVYNALYQLAGSIAASDWRDPATRYLVATTTWSLTNIPGDSESHKLCHIQKWHKHTNVLRYEMWKESWNGGTAWSLLYEWSLADDGTVSTSGSFSLSPNDWMQQYYLSGVPIPSDGPYWLSAGASIGSATETFSAHVVYYDYSSPPTVIYSYDIAADYTLSNETAIPWSVALATAACFQLTERVKLSHPNIGYYDNDGAWQPLDSAGENITIYWDGPADGTPLTIVCDTSTGTDCGMADAPFDGSDNFPTSIGSDAPAAARWLKTAAAEVPGHLSMEKTLWTLDTGSYEVTKKVEALSVPESQGVTGSDWSVAAMSNVDFDYGAPVRVYYAVPTSWMTIEVSQIAPPQ